jgi:hypothetical protein
MTQTQISEEELRERYFGDVVLALATVNEFMVDRSDLYGTFVRYMYDNFDYIFDEVDLQQYNLVELSAWLSILYQDCNEEHARLAGPDEGAG